MLIWVAIQLINAYNGDGTIEHRYESTHTVNYQDSSTFSHGFIVANIVVEIKGCHRV